MEENVTLSISRNDGEGYSSTTTINAKSLDELKRIIQLAGIEEVEDGGVEVIDDGKPACGCEEANEGWLDDEAPVGIEDYEAQDDSGMVDVTFDTEDGNMRVEEATDYDYGHDHPSLRRHEYNISAYDHVGRADSEFRYVPARYGDNPMKSDMDEDAGIHPEQEDEYAQLVNSAARRVKDAIDRGESALSVLDHEAKQIADQMGLATQMVNDEIADQFVMLTGQPIHDYEDDAMSDAVPYGSDDDMEHLYVEAKMDARDVGVLLEDDTDVFASALEKVRRGLFEELNNREVSHLAAAFINLMRNKDRDHVISLHEACRQFLSETEYAGEYRRFVKANRA